MDYHAFRLASRVSLILCITTLLLWIYTYFGTLGWRFFSQDHQQSWTSDIETVRGGIQFRQDIRSPYSFVVSHGPRFGFRRRPAMTKTLLGFGWSTSTYPWQQTFSARRIILTAPWYPLVIVTALLPTVGFFRDRRRRLIEWRRQYNCCLACGYDLRAASEQCPECGAISTRRASSIGLDNAASNS